MNCKFDGQMSTFWTMDISRNSPFLTELASDLDSRYWEAEPPEQWTSEDAWNWISSWAGEKNLDGPNDGQQQHQQQHQQQQPQPQQQHHHQDLPSSQHHPSHLQPQVPQQHHHQDLPSPQHHSSSHLQPQVNQQHQHQHQHIPSPQHHQSHLQPQAPQQHQHQHSPYNGLHVPDHSFSLPSPSSGSFTTSSFEGNLTTLNSPVAGEYSCFTNLPSFDVLRNSCLDLDGQGSSPSSSGCESDRESTSSSMTTVNGRQATHVLTAVENTDPGHTIIDPITGLPGKSLPTLNTPLIVPVKKVGRRGRPPKKDAKSRNRQGKGNGKLWEFIRDLLLDSVTNPSLIRWERREDGVFKFVQSDKVAKLWGQRKQNPRMTYEKLSRAMRYYYKSQVLLPVFGRRLVYKFGPNATGWRANPILMLNE